MTVKIIIFFERFIAYFTDEVSLLIFEEFTESSLVAVGKFVGFPIAKVITYPGIGLFYLSGFDAALDSPG